MIVAGTRYVSNGADDKCPHSREMCSQGCSYAAIALERPGDKYAARPSTRILTLEGGVRPGPRVLIYIRTTGTQGPSEDSIRCLVTKGTASLLLPRRWRRSRHNARAVMQQVNDPVVHGTADAGKN